MSACFVVPVYVVNNNFWKVICNKCLPPIFVCSLLFTPVELSKKWVFLGIVASMGETYSIVCLYFSEHTYHENL